MFSGNKNIHVESKTSIYIHWQPIIPGFFFLKRIKILVLTSMQGATSFSYHLPAQIIKTGVRNAAKKPKWISIEKKKMKTYGMERKLTVRWWFLDLSCSESLDSALDVRPRSLLIKSCMWLYILQIQNHNKHTCINGKASIVCVCVRNYFT